MSELLQQPPFAGRDDALLLREMNALTQWHLQGCPEYRAVWPEWQAADSLAALPFLHVGLFKQHAWRTAGSGIVHQRLLKSSSTSNAGASQIVLDERSSALQAQSSAAILRDLLGDAQRPLLILDSASSLRQRGEVSARVTAAMSLHPLASEVNFLLAGSDAVESLNWTKLVEVCSRHRELLVYGFTWMLWLAWAKGEIPANAREALERTRVHFVHSGGWKKLDSLSVDRAQFDTALLATVGSGSAVLDFYGLVEQVGVIYPLCQAGFRHVPRWAAVLVREPWTLAPLTGTSGLLQLMNGLAWGAPYHNVLSEDLGTLVEGPCPCGRLGQRFHLIGRVPKAEVRGCANV